MLRKICSLRYEDMAPILPGKVNARYSVTSLEQIKGLSCEGMAFNGKGRLQKPFSMCFMAIFIFLCVIFDMVIMRKVSLILGIRAAVPSLIATFTGYILLLSGEVKLGRILSSFAEERLFNAPAACLDADELMALAGDILVMKEFEEGVRNHFLVGGLDYAKLIYSGNIPTGIEFGYRFKKEVVEFPLKSAQAVTDLLQQKDALQGGFCPYFVTDSGDLDFSLTDRAYEVVRDGLIKKGYICG